jgi:hypothetical protein
MLRIRGKFKVIKFHRTKNRRFIPHVTFSHVHKQSRDPVKSFQYTH